MHHVLAAPVCPQIRRQANLSRRTPIACPIVRGCIVYDATCHEALETQPHSVVAPPPCMQHAAWLDRCPECIKSMPVHRISSGDALIVTRSTVAIIAMACARLGLFHAASGAAAACPAFFLLSTSCFVLAQTDSGGAGAAADSAAAAGNTVSTGTDEGGRTAPTTTGGFSALLSGLFFGSVLSLITAGCLFAQGWSYFESFARRDADKPILKIAVGICIVATALQAAALIHRLHAVFVARFGDFICEWSRQ